MQLGHEAQQEVPEVCISEINRQAFGGEAASEVKARAINARRCDKPLTKPICFRAALLTLVGQYPWVLSIKVVCPSSPASEVWLAISLIIGASNQAIMTSA